MLQCNINSANNQRATQIKSNHEPFPNRKPVREPTGRLRTMEQINQTTHQYSTSPIKPDFSYLSVLTAARIERAAYIHQLASRLAVWTGRALIAPFTAMRRRQREYDELMSLDDYILADIGISRGDIPYLINDCANQGKAGNDNSARAA